MSFAVVLALLPPAEPTKAYSGYQFPCDNYSISGYYFGQWVSGSGYHVAEDACSGAGRAVYAAADGQVVYSAKTPDSYRWGNLVMIQHNNGDGSEATGVYAHLSNDRRVSAGQSVSKGQLIGFTGPSYTAENGNWSAHLHFGLKTGPYGAAIGTYSPQINGYRSDGYGPYAHPTNYVNGRKTPPQVYDYQ
ncbi:MAG: M23 family metallopeptidase, partial [Candidatus Micrarchaeota archaeon]|nr:M23 family metallopeptidase [Candidatus Micrarchaeota archaeon]